MIDIASTRQLFLDDYIIDSLDGVTRRYHRPIRSIDHPVLGAVTPWEINSIGPFLFGGTVIYDEEDCIFKMWYRLDEPLEKAPEGIREVVAEDGSISRYSLGSSTSRFYRIPRIYFKQYFTFRDGRKIDYP